MSDQDNPYSSRDHQSDAGVNREDLHSIAALVGNVTGQLKDIDKKIVGDGNSYTQALKINPTQSVKQIMGTVVPKTNSPPPAPPPVNSVPQPAPVPLRVEPTQTVVEQNVDGLRELIHRVEKLEQQISSYKKTFKFKRGISYDINTSSIKGNFKDPQDIVDVILTELAKNAKSITIKLNDANKTRK